MGFGLSPSRAFLATVKELTNVDPFATLVELKARLDWTLDSDEERIAETALEDASELARAYGKNWFDASSAPRMVRTLVLTACSRYMKNPAGYIVSRAGDESLSWDGVGDRAGTPYFTEPEQKLLAGLAGKSSLSSAPLTAWGPVKQVPEGFVPVNGQKPFPLFTSDDGPW